MQEDWGVLKKTHLTKQGTSLGTAAQKGSMQNVEHTKPGRDNGAGIQKQSFFKIMEEESKKRPGRVKTS